MLYLLIFYMSSQRDDKRTLLLLLPWRVRTRSSVRLKRPLRMGSGGSSSAVSAFVYFLMASMTIFRKSLTLYDGTLLRKSSVSCKPNYS